MYCYILFALNLQSDYQLLKVGNAVFHFSYVLQKISTQQLLLVGFSLRTYTLRLHQSRAQNSFIWTEASSVSVEHLLRQTVSDTFAT